MLAVREQAGAHAGGIARGGVTFELFIARTNPLRERPGHGRSTRSGT